MCLASVLLENTENMQLWRIYSQGYVKLTPIESSDLLATMNHLVK